MGYTKSTDIIKLYKKLSADMVKAFNFASPEVAVLESLKPESVKASPREVLFPLDINWGGGVASIENFGYLPDPNTPNVEEAKEYVIKLAGRFDMSGLDIATRSGTAHKDPFAYAVMKKTDAMRRRVAQMFYGFSDGVSALTDTDITTSTTQTLTLRAAYGLAGLGDSKPEYLASLFTVGDTYMLVAAGSDALVDPNAIGRCTATDATAGTVTLQFIGAPSAYTTNGIRIVSANAAARADLDRSITGSDLGKGLVGVLEMGTANSVHGLTHNHWKPALSDSNGGRFNRQKYKKAQAAIAMKGGGKLNTMIIENGVYIDTMSLLAPALRFSDPNDLSLDGEVKAQGVKFIKDSINTPPGMVFGFDRSSIKKWIVSDVPAAGSSGTSISEGIDYIDRDGKVWSVNTVLQMVCNNRANQAIWLGLDSV